MLDSPRVSRLQHACSAVLIFGCILAGVLRFNSCDLLNPDSPRYLIYAQSIVNTGEYRMVDLPGEPIYTWRPPGLSLLLAPALRAFPYDVIAAKAVVLATAGLLLWLVHALASSTSGGWSGPAAVALVGSSPLFLVLSTEVLSEAPYCAAVLAVVYALGMWSQGSSSPALRGRRALWFALVLGALAFAPLIRTVAVSLVVAVGLWSLAERPRRRFLATVAAAILGVVWLARRGVGEAGDNYGSSLLHDLSEQGVPGVVSNAWQTLLYYVGAAPHVVFPGLTNARPFYAVMLPGSPYHLPGLEPLAAMAAVVAVAVGVAGLYATRRHAGGPAALYAPLYVACLAIWPWRHERFLWTLVPVLWAFVPAGLSAIVGRWPRANRLVRPAAMLAVLAVCSWQSLCQYDLVATNQRFVSQRDAFDSEAAPSFYFSDWRQAGEWLRNHTPPHARVLTWHAAVGATAHRYQKRVAFETKTPEQIRQQMQAFSARYLVAPAAQFEDGFPWQVLGGDPACTWMPVFKHRGVAVLAIEPNRTGAVSKTAYEQWIATQLAAVDQFLRKHPGRSDLVVRRASLLREQGRYEEAIADLRGLIDRGIVEVRSCADLGWLLFGQGRYAEAARYLEMARGLPYAEPLAAALTEGARAARELDRDGATPSPERAGALLVNRIESQVASLKLSAAERDAERLLAMCPLEARAHYWRGYLHHVFGESEQAAACYERAVQLGSAEAAGKLRLIRWAEAMARGHRTEVLIGGVSETVDPSMAASHVRQAQMLDEHGWQGRALATLESARQQFGDDPQIVIPLADLYCRFARPELAAPLYRLVDDPSAREKLLRAEAALREPRF